MCPMDTGPELPQPSLHMRWIDDVIILSTDPELGNSIRQRYSDYKTTSENCSVPGGVAGVFAGVKFRITRYYSEAYTWVRPQKRAHWMTPTTGQDQSAVFQNAKGLLIGVLRASPPNTWPPGATATARLLIRHGYTKLMVTNAIRQATRLTWNPKQHSDEARPPKVPVPVWSERPHITQLEHLWVKVLIAEGQQPKISGYSRSLGWSFDSHM